MEPTTYPHPPIPAAGLTLCFPELFCASLPPGETLKSGARITFWGSYRSKEQTTPVRRRTGGPGGPKSSQAKRVLRPMGNETRLVLGDMFMIMMLC